MRDYIGFFNSAIAWGGGEKWHFETSVYLHERGYKVLVFAHSKSVLIKKLKEKEIPHVAVLISNLSFLNPLKHIAIQKQLRLKAIHTLVINLSQDVKIAGFSAKAIGIKRIIYRRGSAIPIKNTFINRFYFKNIITDVLVNSRATKETVIKNNPYLFPKEKISVIYNGINIPTEAIDKKRLTDEKRPTRLLNLGRLEAQKNQVFLVSLAQELKKRNLSFELVIGGEGRLRSVLQKKIDELDVDDVVRLEGFIEYPIEFLKKGDIFLLPSLWEGFGYVLAEAAVCEMPAIAFDLSSNPELIINEKTGMLITPKDIKEFANAVEKLCHNTELRKRMGKQAALHVKTHFDKKKNLQKIEKYLINE